ncbi:hypothetical protein OHB04_22840 [Streptomyces sp. NBC_01775]|uniref:hypothetical protein n=1 Tax=Streptomyces sp. NBC_01775 TaxID=2975939 RepID=UPI002DDC5CB0|nr:hypothetical protein [Streptomyces sp. NBC_01775]WSB78332.1 hypothetical protein OHB04_22840 [Streptomyces sp. NBC_01775]
MRDVRMLGTGQLLEMQRRLRAAGNESLRASMQRRVRRAAEPLKSDLQSAIRHVPISSPGRSTRRGGPSPTTRPLRATLAEALRISVRTSAGSAGARVWVDKVLLPPDLRNMPDTINSGRIRHPVYGNRRRWVTQTAPPLWWDRAVRNHTPRMIREVARVLDDVRRRLT